MELKSYGQPRDYLSLLPPKILLIMKLTTILWLIGLCQISAKTFSQTVNLSGKDMPLEQVLDNIAKQSGYFLFYKYNELKEATPVTLNLQNVPVEQALKQSFKGQPFDFVVENKTIVVTKKEQRQQQVRGFVTDEKGEPLPGASIRIKGVNQGALSDQNGAFTLANVDDDAVLVVSYTGYTMQEIPLDGQDRITISLRADQLGLNEVVIVGYGTQRKVNVTGSVSSIGTKDIAGRPTTSVGSVLQGQMPGVTVVNNTALPGNNGGTIRIRGIGTLNDASPLLVIDGVPSGDINILNPADIESVTVLKDAASSSIYGVRGANGVILITTKSGKNNEKPGLSYQNYFGLQTPTALPKFLGSVEYMQLVNESKLNVGANPSYTDEQIEIARSGSDPNHYANTNWIEEMYESSAPQQSHTLAASGGSDNSTYYASYSYLKEGGLLTGNNYHAGRHNARLRLTTTLLDRLKLDANVGYIDRAYSGANEDLGAGTGPIYAAHQISPLVPVRFTTGGWGYLGGSRNPVAVVTDGGYNDFGSQELTTNLQATLDITKHFRLRGQYGLVKSNSLRAVFSKTINYYSPDDNSLIYQTNSPNTFTNTDYTNFYQTFLGMAEYENTFKGGHYFKAMAAASSEETISKTFKASRTNLPTQDVPNLNLGTENQLNSATASQNALRSVLGRINYAFNEKYMAEANMRYDGSSRFAAEKRWHAFLSGSLGWAFSEEAFFAPLKDVIEFGKIRASYGSQGNDKVGSDYAYLATIGSVTAEPIGNELTVGYAQTGVPNGFLTWESVDKKDIGIDLTLLKGRMGITVDYYVNNTKNILLNVPLPDVLGNAYPPQNAGKVENKGWELQVSWRDSKGDFSYGVSANVSDVKNKVLSLGDAPATVGNQVRMVGYPINAFYGFVSEGIAQIADFDYDASTNTYTPRFPYDESYPMQPGDIKYQDLNGDGRITADADMQVIGSPIPRYTYGFKGDLAYKGFDFSFFFQGVAKADGFIDGSARHAFINDYTNPQEVHRDHWTPENPDASYPRLAYGYSYNQRLSTYWLENAAYLRLKNVQIGYTLPKRITEKFRVSNLRIYASADNLFTKTDFFYGYDPESPVSTGGFYPQVKTFVFGLNINLN